MPGAERSPAGEGMPPPQRKTSLQQDCLPAQTLLWPTGWLLLPKWSRLLAKPSANTAARQSALAGPKSPRRAETPVSWPRGKPVTTFNARALA